MKILRQIFLLAVIAVKAANCYSQSNSNLQHVVTEKNPGISFALSALLPGAGQMYNGKVKEGLIIFVAVPALIISGSALLAYQEKPSNVKEENERTAHTWGTVIVAAGVLGYLAQLAQAPIYSQKWNRKNGFITSESEFEMNIKAGQFALCYRF